jgi:hypothetical protein
MPGKQIKCTKMSLLTQASLVLIPSGYKEDTVYSVIPSDGSGDLSFTRASDGTRINSDGLVENTPWNLLRYSEQFNNGVWVLFASGTGVNPIVTANTTTAPNGTLTADTIVLNAGAGTTASDQSQIYQTFSNVIGNIYTVSFYAKGIVGGEQLMIRHARGSTYTKITLTNQWERYSVTETSTYTGTGFLEILIRRGQNEPINASATFFLWGAQLNIGSTAKPYFPTTDRLNVPRLTYQNGGGGCPSLLLEPQRTNVATYSQEFDNASWTKNFTTITANSTTSPDGTQNAETLTGDATITVHFISGATRSVISGTTYSISIYAKKNTNNFIQILGGGTAFGVNVWGNFDLNNGVVGSIGSSTTASIVNAGNGWYRCTISGAAILSGNIVVDNFALITSATSIRAEGNSLNTSVFIWGAQLEAGAYASSYIPTTSASATRIADGFTRANVYTNGFITASGGTWFVEFTNNLTYTRDNGNNTLILADLLATNFFRFRNDGSVNSSLRLQKNISGTTTDLFILPAGNVKIAVKWNGTTADAFLNGTKLVSATPFTATQLENLTSVPQVPIFISQMILFPTALSDSNCVTLTTI